jgi:predicted component of type VI protein secretion system
LGRATDSQFVVYDPERFSSRHHAMISAYEGAYYVENASASGTLINNIELLVGQCKTMKTSTHCLIPMIFLAMLPSQQVRQIDQVKNQHSMKPCPPIKPASYAFIRHYDAAIKWRLSAV